MGMVHLIYIIIIIIIIGFTFLISFGVIRFSTTVTTNTTTTTTTTTNTTTSAAGILSNWALPRRGNSCRKKVLFTHRFDWIGTEDI